MKETTNEPIGINNQAKIGIKSQYKLMFSGKDNSNNSTKIIVQNAKPCSKASQSYKPLRNHETVKRAGQGWGANKERQK